MTTAKLHKLGEFARTIEKLIVFLIIIIVMCRSDQNEVVSLQTWRTASTNISSQEISTQFHSSQLDSQDGSSATMLDNQEYIMRPQIEQLRQMDMLGEPDMLNTPISEQIDSPPPFQWPRQTMSQDSLRSATPINEKLYQPGLQLSEDPTYAMIRPNARREERQLSASQRITPVDYMTSNVSYINNDTARPEKQRRATLPANMRSSPNRRPILPTSPTHYTKPHPFLPGQRYPQGNQTAAMSSPALHQPVPYSEPVSSMSSLRNVGVSKVAHRPPVPVTVNRSISSPTAMADGQMSGGKLTNPLQAVNEHGPPQQWYQDNGESDIVTPSSAANFHDNSIEPYAVMLSPVETPQPYSHPTVVAAGGSGVSSDDWQNSPSTIRPNHLAAAAAVQYETINV